MLIVPKSAYVNEGGDGAGAINMIFVPEAAFPYYWESADIAMGQYARCSHSFYSALSQWPDLTLSVMTIVPFILFIKNWVY